MPLCSIEISSCLGDPVALKYSALVDISRLRRTLLWARKNAACGSPRAQHHGRLRQEGKRWPTQTASVSGSAKAGKTVRVQRVIGEGYVSTVGGASVRTADQLWDRVLDWWGEPHATMASHVDTSNDTA